MTRRSKSAPEFSARASDLYRSSEGRRIADVARELGSALRRSASGCAKTKLIAGERVDSKDTCPETAPQGRTQAHQ